MSALNEDQGIGALAYGITVLPASIAATGFFPIEVPLLFWLALAAVGGLGGGALFWERRMLAGALAFGLSGALSPFAVAAYVNSSMPSAVAYSWVEFSVFELFMAPMGLLVIARLFMLLSGVAQNILRARRASVS